MDYLKYSKELLNKKGKSTNNDEGSTLNSAVNSLIKAGIIIFKISIINPSLTFEI